jgi:hypothetical protein
MSTWRSRCFGSRSSWTDDRVEIDRISEAISEVVCPFPVGHGHSDHDCPVPWFIVGSEMSEAEARDWIEVLNR